MNNIQTTHKLNCKWILWAHKFNNTNWDINSYEKIYEFDTIEDFWRLYNNFSLIGGLQNKNYFLMRDGIVPTWEDKKNKNGGICSIKLSMSRAEEVWTLLSMYLIGECYYDDINKMDDLNGISFCPKNIWCIIKIWNADSNNDISKIMPQKILNKLNKCSIMYKPTISE